MRKTSAPTNTNNVSLRKWSNSFQINILDTSFIILTNEDPDHINHIHTYLKKEIEKMRQSTNMEDPLKLSILTGLALVNNLLKARTTDGQKSLESMDPMEAEEITMRLIAEIDEIIKEPKE